MGSKPTVPRTVCADGRTYLREHHQERSPRARPRPPGRGIARTCGPDRAGCSRAEPRDPWRSLGDPFARPISGVHIWRHFDFSPEKSVQVKNRTIYSL